MSVHRYPWPALRGDYLRAAAGLVLTGVPLLAVPDNSVTVAVLGVLAALFALFALRTAARHSTRFELTEDGLARSGLGGGALGSGVVAWRTLETVSLAFYAIRRSRPDGWLQLKIRGPGRTLRLESTLDGFEIIAARAAAAAAANGISLGQTTRRNLSALGIAVDGDGARATGDSRRAR